MSRQVLAGKQGTTESPRPGLARALRTGAGGALAALCLVASGAAVSQQVSIVPGVDAERIRFGTSGTSHRTGERLNLATQALVAYFASVNSAGGVGGRRLEMLSADDNFQFYRTKRMARSWVGRDLILGMVGNMGGKTNSAVAKELNKRKVPHLYFTSWRGDLATPDELPWSIRLAPSPVVVGASIGRYVLGLKPRRVAVLHAKGARYSDDSLAGLRQVLGGQAAVELTEFAFDYVAEDLESRVDALVASKPDVVVNLLFGDHLRVAGAAIAEKAGDATQIAGLDLWTHRDLPATAESRRIVVPSMVKRADADSTDAAAFRAWAAKQAGPIAKNVDDPLVAYGYLSGALLVHTLEAASESGLSRASLLAAAQSLDEVTIPMLGEGIALSTSKRDYHPVEQLAFRERVGGQWSSVGTW